MAVFYDFDDEDDCSSNEQSHIGEGLQFDKSHPSAQSGQLRPADSGAADRNEMGHNIQVEYMSTNRLAAALACYPIALSLSINLDLNDLHALAASCRSVHNSLAQYAYQLKSYSLRCMNDGTPVLAEALMSQKDELHRADTLGTATAHIQAPAEATAAGWPIWESGGLYASVGAVSKMSSCARDLVAPCRRCGIVVCRNCVAKSPSSARLKERFRRLCKTCLDAPLEAHLKPLASSDDANDGPPTSSASSMRSERSFSGSSASSCTSALEKGKCVAEEPPVFSWPAFLRDPCTCESRGVFLCAPCGQNLRSADTTYKRVWTWRSRYSTHIGGGLGTGLGEGNQGQKCGRGEDCLVMGGKAVCWVEIDCSEGSGLDSHNEADRYGLSRVSTPDASYSSNKPGYLQQEIEGIGGVVKKKVKKRIKVGATVWEYEDERESGKYLEREAKGIARSWCGWCGRVCLSENDREDPRLTLLGR